MNMKRFVGKLVLTTVAIGSPALVLATPNKIHPKTGHSEIHTKMVASSADPYARGMAHYKVAGGRSRFHLTLQNLAPGAYELELDGTSVAFFSVSPSSDGTGGTSAVVQLKSAKGGPSFDPRGHRLSVSSGGVAHLTSNFPSSHKEAMATVDIRATFDNMGVQPEASCVAHYRSKLGQTRFSVGVEGLASGSYDLFVGGVLEGSLAVDSMGESELRFDTRLSDDDAHGDNGDELLLTFEPRGQLLQVEQQGVVVLQVGFPAM